LECSSIALQELVQNITEENNKNINKLNENKAVIHSLSEKQSILESKCLHLKQCLSESNKLCNEFKNSYNSLLTSQEYTKNELFDKDQQLKEFKSK